MAYHPSNGGYSEDESRSGDDYTDTDLRDKPNYLLEHLATFTVSKESGIVFPADGMRRLLQLEKTTGIWSQKMQLCLDRQWILIMDYETRNIIERFPAQLIAEPTAFTSNSTMDMYNNVLVFIVGDGSGARSEMHIFQCQSVSAVSIVEDLKQLRSGKAVTQHRNTIPLPMRKSSATHSQSQQHHGVGESFHRNSYDRSSSVVGGGGGGGGGSVSAIGGGISIGGGGGGQETDSDIEGGINDDVSSTSSEKYERDVMVLNHCFDDIEKFIARLQHSAAASRELERRRHNRKSKKKDPGEGLLSLRTKPPHEKEFIDIFAKFKLSFILLAKLKAHIHDPNAPELVHFLFTPLALIVDASHDTYYDPNIPSRVVNPLLTREAINLLINCVTSKETELWRSLGDAWTTPREQWKGHVGLYHPVFFDGWSPDFPVIDDIIVVDQHTPTEIRRRSTAAMIESASSSHHIVGHSQQHHHQQQQHHHQHQHYGGGGGDYEYDSKFNPPGSPGLRDFSAKSDISLDSIERNGGGPSAGASSAMMMAREMAMNSGAGSSSKFISGSKDISSTELWLEDVRAKGAKVVQVTYPRTANNDKELTVVRGEFLEILDDSRKWWKAKNSRGQIAHVPHTIVTPFNYSSDYQAQPSTSTSMAHQNYPRISSNKING